MTYRWIWFLIRLVDMGFSRMFSDPHCRYTEPSGGSHVDQIGGHGFQWVVLRSSLQVFRAYMWIRF